jgi:hypothetical protein
MQATSIIRSKPEGVTSKQYAIQLASKLKTSETSWKTKVRNFLHFVIQYKIFLGLLLNLKQALTKIRTFKVGRAKNKLTFFC